MPIYAAARLSLTARGIRGPRCVSHNCELWAPKAPRQILPRRALSSTPAGNALENKKQPLSSFSDDIRGIYDACSQLEVSTMFDMPDVVDASTRLSERPKDTVRIAGTPNAPR